jgi:hypothetical protein
VVLVGGGRQAIRVTNPGALPVVVDAGVAGFALDLRGRPRIVAHGEVSQHWLRVSPRRLRLAPRAGATVRVVASLPAHPRAGDHEALVLLTTRVPRQARVAVRMQLGVVVDVRVPGRIVRRLDVRRLQVRRRGAARLLELTVVNRGNVSEPVGPSFGVSLFRDGRLLTRLRPEARELLPRTAGLAEALYRGAARGWVIAVVDVLPGPGAHRVQRAFRVRL